MSLLKRTPKNEKPVEETPPVVSESTPATPIQVTIENLDEQVTFDPPLKVKPNDTIAVNFTSKLDPNELHEKLLKENNLQLDFDVLEGTIPTKFGIIKLPDPTLVIKASYVERK